MANALLQGDCLEQMQKYIPNGYIDMILTDPPYGTTNCKWDSIIPLEPMWKQLKRIIKPNSAIVMTAVQPFTSVLITSNIKMFKYNWVWNKNKGTGHLNSKRMPMKCHEDILLFYSKQCTYNAQKTTAHKSAHTVNSRSNANNEVFGLAKRVSSGGSTKRFPLSILNFNTDNNNSKRYHPTQKPVALIEYLIKTYTNEGETVLDFTMGSGTTGVACKNLNRNFIGIELDKKYFEIAKKRINEA